MDSYTITIAPNDDSGAATRLVIDTSGDQVRITDVHLHAPQGLSSGHIPTVDFDLLLRAVTGTGTGPNAPNVAGAAALPAQHGVPALEASAAARPAEQSPAPAASTRPARKTAPRVAKAPAPRPARKRAAAAASGEKSAAPQRSSRAAATSTTRTAKQSPAKATRKAAPASTPPAPARKQTATRATARAGRQTTPKQTRAATTADGGRVYRRTPNDLAAVFEHLGTVAGVAAHYQVPRHTAQGWVNRLRATTSAPIST